MSTLLTMELYRANIFPKVDFYQMAYEYFYLLSHFTDKNSFHSLMNEIFSETLTKLRRKDKIRLAFVTDHAAMWCGDEECEDKVKELTGVCSRCIPFEQEHLSDTCVCCGKPAKHMVYWGKAY